MRIDIHEDLTAFIREMATWNGISRGRYTNSLIEKGIQADLEEAGYTDESISQFRRRLVLAQEPDFSLLVPTPPEDCPLVFKADMEIHKDWYMDEIISGERVYRLDFSATSATGRTNAFQAQLFAKLPIHLQACDEDAEAYCDFRLFLERDNRNDEGERIDYACHVWAPLPRERALWMLSLSAKYAGPGRALLPECEYVANLKCEFPTFLNGLLCEEKPPEKP